jgi:hypothetical protein
MTDVGCVAKKCTNTAAPTREQAEATNKCFADCDSKKDNTDQYKTCTASCIQSHFMADSPAAQNGTNGSSKNGNSTSNKNGTSSGTAAFGTSSATYSTMVAAVALFASFFVL